MCRAYGARLKAYGTSIKAYGTHTPKTPGENTAYVYVSMDLFQNGISVVAVATTM